MGHTGIRLNRSATHLVLLAVGLFALVGLVACQPSQVQMHGEVRDASSGALLTGVSMTFTPREGTAKALTISLPSGSYAVDLDSGDYAVSISALGYLPGSFDVSLAAHSQLMRDIKLERVQLTGAVSDALNGAPVSQARLGYDGVLATTDARGRFALDWRADVTITVSSEGYLPQQIALEKKPDQLGDLAIQLVPRTLVGTVVERDTGTALRGIEIQMGDQIAHTDAEGAFTLTHLPDTASLQVQGSGYVPLTVSYASENELALELEPWQVLVSVTEQGSQAPLPGASVTSGDHATLNGDRATLTNNDGSILVRTALAAKIIVAHDGYYSMTFTYDGQEHVDVVLRPSRLVVELCDALTSAVITNALVLTYQNANHPVADSAMPADEAGKIIIDDLMAVSQILVKAPGYRKVSLPITRGGKLAVELEPFGVKAIYIPFGLLTLPDRIETLLDMVEGSAELNGVVIDAKSDRARLAWPSDLALAQEMEAYQRDVMDLALLLEKCDARGIYAIARIVVFKDNLLAVHRPDWAVKRDTGELYVDLEELHWVDPFRQEVRDYNIGLALEVAAMGFEEIQFDYLRFPSDGSTKGLVYARESTFETRTAAMAAFCGQFYEALQVTPAFVAADIFGLTIWVDPARDMGIGQRLDDIAPHVDFLCPMLYPTTFGEGNLGFDDPGLYPYEILYHSVLKAHKRTTTRVRPWLQSYSIGSYDYGAAEYLMQKKGAEDGGSQGWIFWNAGGKYMPEVFAADAYDLLDEIPQPPAGD